MIANKNLSGDVMLLRERDASGEQAYYFVKPHAGKQIMLGKMPRGTQYNIEEYGVILASGYGNPEGETIAWVNSEYGTEFVLAGEQETCAETAQSGPMHNFLHINPQQ
jgi:hypothetical protein